MYLSSPCIHAILQLLEDIDTECIDLLDIQEDLIDAGVGNYLARLLVELLHHLTEVHSHHLDMPRIPVCIRR